MLASLKEKFMEFLRTSDDRFANLPGYEYSPNYSDLDDGEGGKLCMHYVDAGPKDAEPVLLVHGQPTWSYLYRKMIPVLTAAGHRVIAPDLIGFGRSDKPTRREDYTYARHVAWLGGLVRNLGLVRITLFGQDWGGLIGLRVLAEDTGRFARVVVANTGLPDCSGIPNSRAAEMHRIYDSIEVPQLFDLPKHFTENTGGHGFFYWVKFCAETPELPIGMLVGGFGGLNAEEITAYDAPFPDESYKAGARQFPSLVPIIPDNPAVAANREAWNVLRGFDKPFLTAFSDSDPVTRGGEKRFQAEVPGAQGQAHVTIEGAGHFLQEQKGSELARIICDFIAANPHA